MLSKNKAREMSLAYLVGKLQRFHRDGLRIKLLALSPFGAVNDIPHQLATRRINIITTSLTNRYRVLILHQGFLETIDA